nr:MAG TPA: hypothetical protein [Caudoviricetes sp.]
MAIYLALYKHKRDWRKEPIKAIADRITRFFTKGKILALRDCH